MRGPETEKGHELRKKTGFYQAFCQGQGLDIGYRGVADNTDPVLETATGIDIGYPSYDGLHLPFENETQDYVFTSHVLEHLNTPIESIREWFRVLKQNRFLILIVPHRDLYEKKLSPPSKWNADHKRFYTPLGLLSEIEMSLKPNTYRVVSLKDNDRGYDYSIDPNTHAVGGYEIECVLKKIKPPTWELK